SLINPIQVRAYITETELGKVKPGMQALIYIDAYPDKPIKGQVGFISPQAEFTPKNVETKALRTDLVYRIRIVAEDKQGILRQGMPVSIVIKQNIMNNQVIEKNPDVLRNPY
ncbi:MAG TPA: HlyD family efflux transporter periplasmic adaptor subunit, partial [Candidatus Berkiella sp.]|nr:HlyD family efflux transporter periplasmic adaptor subunit [Candidatus Berkiella sp.]